MAGDDRTRTPADGYGSGRASARAASDVSPRIAQSVSTKFWRTKCIAVPGFRTLETDFEKQIFSVDLLKIVKAGSNIHRGSEITGRIAEQAKL